MEMENFENTLEGSYLEARTNMAHLIYNSLHELEILLKDDIKRSREDKEIYFDVEKLKNEYISLCLKIGGELVENYSGLADLITNVGNLARYIGYNIGDEL